MCSSNIFLELTCNVLTVRHELNHCIYRVIQEGKSIFWEVMISVIVREKLYEYVSDSELLPRYICLNVQIRKRCE
jgi:hypothetical protein